MTKKITIILGILLTIAIGIIIWLLLDGSADGKRPRTMGPCSEQVDYSIIAAQYFDSLSTVVGEVANEFDNDIRGHESEKFWNGKSGFAMQNIIAGHNDVIQGIITMLHGEIGPATKWRKYRSMARNLLKASDIFFKTVEKYYEKHSYGGAAGKNDPALERLEKSKEDYARIRRSLKSLKP